MEPECGKKINLIEYKSGGVVKNVYAELFYPVEHAMFYRMIGKNKHL